jgi:hypothetical protein
MVFDAIRCNVELFVYLFFHSSISFVVNVRVRVSICVSVSESVGWACPCLGMCYFPSLLELLPFL